MQNPVSLKVLNTYLPYDPKILLLGILSSQVLRTSTWILVYKTAFIIAKEGNNFHQQMNGLENSRLTSCIHIFNGTLQE